MCVDVLGMFLEKGDARGERAAHQEQAGARRCRAGERRGDLFRKIHLSPGPEKLPEALVEGFVLSIHEPDGARRLLDERENAVRNVGSRA